MVLRNTVRYGSVPPVGTATPAKTQRVVTFARTTFQRRPSVQDTIDDAPVSDGRDGWSAYNVSSAALDEFDDLAYKSKRRDAEILSDANRCMEHVDALASLPAYKSKYRPLPAGASKARSPAVLKERASVVAAAADKPKNRTTPAAAQSPAVVRAYIDRRLGKQAPAVYECDQEHSYQLTTVANKGDLLKAQNKLLAAEPVDLDASATVAALKARLREASDLADRQKLLLDRYITDPAADEAKRHLEKIRVSSEQRLEGAPAKPDLPKVSPLRTHLRDVLQRCGKNYPSGDS